MWYLKFLFTTYLRIKILETYISELLLIIIEKSKSYKEDMYKSKESLHKFKILIDN